MLFGKKMFWLLGFIILGALFGLFNNKKTEAKNEKRTPCVLLSVYDGDTFGCDLNNDQKITNPQEHVRLLGIDATEMRWSRKNKTGKDQPFAREAMAVLEAKKGKTLWLEKDVVWTDKYNRRLAYVYTQPSGGKSLNQSLLEQGLAYPLFIGQNRKYEGAFLKAVLHAKLEKKALYNKP